MTYVKQTWENLPSENTPISADRLAHMETQYDTAFQDSSEYTDASFRNIRPQFSLEQARVSYGATFGIVDRFVMQGAFPVQGDNNRWYCSRNTTGTEAGRETSILTRVSSSGSGAETMTFIDGGHGDSFFVEVEGDISYVWANFTDWRYPTSEPSLRYNFIRMPWSPGTYTYPEVEQFRVNSISGINWRASFDERSRVIAFRTGGGSFRSMSAYSMDEVKASETLPEPLATSSVPMLPEYGSVQDHAYMLETGRWFFLFGGVSGEQAVVSYNPSGDVEFIKRIDQLISVDAWGKVFSVHEPEGLTIHHDPSGNPSLIFGVATGTIYARKSHVYSIDMGVKSSSFDLLSRHLPSDISPWVRSSVSSAAILAPGFSESSTRPFAIRISNQEVNLRGRIEGVLDSSVSLTHHVATLNESFYPSQARQAIGVLQGSGRVVRIEIGTTGRIVVYLPSGDTTSSYTWVDFDTTKFWMGEI